MNGLQIPWLSVKTKGKIIEKRKLSADGEKLFVPIAIQRQPDVVGDVCNIRISFETCCSCQN